MFPCELPDQAADPILHRIVTINMVHGPCGVHNPNCVCMKDNRCSKRYPKSFLNETQIGEDGFPLYRKRSPENGGGTFPLARQGSDITIDNSWIVPYSPYLSRKFDAHINVEPCMFHKSIKYLCKHINKGSDMAVVHFEREGNERRYDEIAQYLLGRYISVGEALWRCFESPIHERYLPAIQLDVNLENEQRIQLTESNAHLRVNAPVSYTHLTLPTNREV